MRNCITPHHAPALVLAIVLVATGCSTTKIAVNAFEPILENTKTASLASDDLRTFTAATPSNITLLEGLIETQPHKESFRIDVSMLYFAYAFTQGPSDEQYASLLYRKGFEHARTVLLKNQEFAAVWDAPFTEFEQGVSRIRSRDLEALVWTVANWSQFISLHLDSTEVLLAIPRVTALLERAVELDGSFFGSLPHIILGSLHAFRPPMLGGDPEASKANFETAIAQTDGRFLLAKYFFARFYCHRVLDDELFETTLRDVINQPDDLWPEYRLLNVLAIEKSRQLIKEKDDLF